MRGLSGAIVEDNGSGTVKKTGGIVERTIEQGQWIVAHGGNMFPRVHEFLPDGYVMEELEFIEYWDTDVSFNVSALKTHVWSQPAVVPPTKNTAELLKAKMAHTIDKYLHGLVSPGTRAAILTNANNAGKQALFLRHCLTHGDPTAENVMRRRGNGYVFIDPIGASEVVPDSPAVDIGKMLQSAYGWEDAKYSNGILAYSHSDVKNEFIGKDDEELFAAGEYWAVVHVMRAVPYVLRGVPDALPRVLKVLERSIERW